MEYLFASKEQLDKDFMQNLHTSSFDYFVDADSFRVDAGYIAKDQEQFFGYVLYRELSSDCVELVYGAVDRNLRGFKTFKTLYQFIKILFEKYSSITTMVWNKNHKMLKLYMALGFNITGIKMSPKNDLFVILNKERE
jgi:ribosomal protein S18 acetylase RimI-like enzyme